MHVHASAVVQCLASSSSVTVRTSPPVLDISLVFLQSLIQSSMPQPGPRLTRLFEDLAGSEIDLFTARVVFDTLNVLPGEESVCFGFIEGDPGVDKERLDVLEVIARLLDAGEFKELVILLKNWFLFCDSFASGDIGAGSVTMLGGGSLMAGTGDSLITSIPLVYRITR